MSMLDLAALNDLVEEEAALDARVIHLAANETVLSPFAQRVLSLQFGNRYLLEHLDMREESPSRLGNVLVRGLDCVNAIERSATEACRELFGASYVEFRCLSGLHALQATIAALTKPGDAVMRVATKDGGHPATEEICRLFGRESYAFAFNRQTNTLDRDGTRDLIQAVRPRLLYVDAINWTLPFPLAELRALAGDALIVFDASATLGLIAGGQYQDPLREGADLIVGNTHTTFFGPQKGLILGNDREAMERVNYWMSTAMVSSQHTAETLALLIAVHEARDHGHEYAARVVNNARHLANALHRRGLPLLFAADGFTRNHMLFIDTRDLGFGPALLDRLLRANIAATRTLPFEHVDALRIGVQEITRRGYTEDDLDQIAEWLTRLLLEGGEPERIRDAVTALAQRRQDVLYTGDPTHRPASAAPGARPRARSMRWITVSLQRIPCRVDERLFDAAQKVGRVAAGFEHQSDSSGNLSVRREGHVVVSATGCYIKTLQSNDLVEIVAYAGGRLVCRGVAPPTTEAYMHYLIHQYVDCAMVVHNHYLARDLELERFEAAVVPPQPYGSIALAESVAEACTHARIVYVQKHGLVIWGQTPEECAALLNAFAEHVSRRHGHGPRVAASPMA